MLSYRHGFHAGNHADVLKHALLVFIGRYLQQKDSPLLYLDTHAGAGLYDLRTPEADKTGEYRDGIGRVMPHAATAPALFADYLAMVRSFNGDDGLTAYPGSPSLINALMRSQDRAHFNELHPTDETRLADLMRRGNRVHVEKTDGLRALIAQLPPAEKRALVLVDPSYEIKTDYALVVTALARAWKKFPGGIYLVWYPVIDRARVQAMEVALRAAAMRKIYRVELCTSPDTPERGMTGSGLFIVNPPFTLPDAAADGLPWLARALGATGPVTSGWLIPE